MIGEILVSVTLIVGSLFALVGSFGLVKLKDPMARLHAPTKASTLGVGSLLAASSIYAFFFGDGSLHEILILLFLFVTAPVSAHFIAKAHIHRHGRHDRLPRPHKDSHWAVQNGQTEE